MTIWTPKDEAGIKTQWHPFDVEDKATWEESNILVYSTEIKQVRIIHLENVYRYMWHYLTEEGWKHPKKGKQFEDFYGEYRDQEDHKEVRWWWRMQKSPGGIGGKHQYFRQKVYVDCLTTNMKRVEIMYKGKKIKPYMGEFLLWFNSVLELDVHDWFENHWLLKILKDFFPRMIYKQRIREQEIELRRFSERFVEDVKHFIGLNRVSEARKPMEPEKQFF